MGQLSLKIQLIVEQMDRERVAYKRKRRAAGGDSEKLRKQLERESEKSFSSLTLHLFR